MISHHRVDQCHRIQDYQSDWKGIAYVMVVKRIYPFFVKVGQDLRRAVYRLALSPVVSTPHRRKVHWVKYFVPSWITNVLLVYCLLIKVDELRRYVSMIALFAIQMFYRHQQWVKQLVHYIYDRFTYLKAREKASSGSISLLSNLSASIKSTLLTCFFHCNWPFTSLTLFSRCGSSSGMSCLVFLRFQGFWIAHRLMELEIHTRDWKNIG